MNEHTILTISCPLTPWHPPLWFCAGTATVSQFWCSANSDILQIRNLCVRNSVTLLISHHDSADMDGVIQTSRKHSASSGSLLVKYFWNQNIKCFWNQNIQVLPCLPWCSESEAACCCLEPSVTFHSLDHGLQDPAATRHSPVAGDTCCSLHSSGD